MNARAAHVQARVSCVLVTDQQHARLFSAGQHNGRLHLKEIASHPNTLKPHDRGGKPSASGPQRAPYADADRDHDVMRDQFAADVVSWLNDQLKQQPLETMLTLFAPPEFLGALRSAMEVRPLPVPIVEHAADLTWLSTSELERHPAVKEELTPPA